jgi:DNA-directed RNA polymerase I, II, and III subunit RPABC2
MDSDSEPEINHSDEEDDDFVNKVGGKNKSKKQDISYDDSDSDEADISDSEKEDVEVGVEVDSEKDDDESEKEKDDDDDYDANEEPGDYDEEKEKESIKKNIHKLTLEADADDSENDDGSDKENDDDDDDNINYLQKFDISVNKNYVNDYHPECLSHNYDEIEKLTIVVKNENSVIVDPFHKTIPFLTKYEKTRVLGQRAKQIEEGSLPFIKLPENIIDAHIIAEMELKEKKIPFIIRRPIPGGAFEYWKLGDLEIINL